MTAFRQCAPGHTLYGIVMDSTGTTVPIAAVTLMNDGIAVAYYKISHSMKGLRSISSRLAPILCGSRL